MGIKEDSVLLLGKGIAEVVEPVQHKKSGCPVHWITKVKNQKMDWDKELEADEAVCRECGAESKVVERRVEKNYVVESKGKESAKQFLNQGHHQEIVRPDIEIGDGKKRDLSLVYKVVAV